MIAKPSKEISKHDEKFTDPCKRIAVQRSAIHEAIVPRQAIF